MRALVTGATGFVGRHTLEPLVRRGFEVHAVARRPPRDTGGEWPAAGVTWHAADLLAMDEAASLIDRVRSTHLLHLAWFAEPGAYWTASENLDWVGASLRLLRAFGEHGGERVVIAGSSAEYEWGGEVCTERETPLRPATLYGAAKHGLHVVAAAYARRVGLSLAWARPFFLYGPHERPERLVPSIARPLLAGQPAPCTDGDQLRDFLYVPDAGDALAALLDSSVEGPVNVASGEGTRVRAVAELTAEAAGRPQLLRVGELPRPPGDPDAIVAGVGRLGEEVGWRARTGIEDGIARTVAWWRERNTR